MYLCKNCSAGLHFDPASQKLICDHCGSSYDPEEYGRELLSAETESSFEAIVYTCPQCGSVLYTTDETAATFCSYCGNNILLKSRMEQVANPDRIIPFGITRDEVKNAYRRMLKNSLFVPSAMKKEETIDHFRGIYMPYWIYSFRSSGKRIFKGKKERRKGDYIYRDHYRLETDIDAEWEGVSCDSSRSFSDSLSRAIAPFNAAEAKEFTPVYFSGFYADVPTVDQKVYAGEAKELCSEDGFRQLRASAPEYRKYEVDQEAAVKALHIEHEKTESGYFPVWFLATRNRKGDRVSYAVVNGQTGKIAADLPVSAGKFLLGSIILAIPIFFLLNLFLTLTPAKCLLAVILLSIVSMVVLNTQINRVYTRENRLDDCGYIGKVKEREKPIVRFSGRVLMILIKLVLGFALWIVIFKMAVPLVSIAEHIKGDTALFAFGIIWGILFMVVVPAVILIYMKKLDLTRLFERTEHLSYAPFGMKWGAFLKPVLSILLAIAVLFMEPVQDSWYYGGAVVCMLVAAASFIDIIYWHNRLTERKLPQFETRGGEEDA